MPKSMIEEILELAGIEEHDWDEVRDRIPSWHPRNDGDDGDDGDDGADDDDADGDDADADDDDADADANQTPEQKAQAIVDKAHAKLRAAEKERDKLRKQVQKAERAGLDELERTKAELEDSRAETAAMQQELDKAENEKTIIRVAKGLKFKNPEKVARFVNSDSTTEKDIKADLKEALEDYPELASGKKPRTPVDDTDDDDDAGKSTNRKMNDVIRRAAGKR